MSNRIVIYSSVTQSFQEIEEVISFCFSQPDCRYKNNDIIDHFQEVLNEVEARTFSELKAAIQACQSKNAALLVVRELEGKGYLESLRLLHDSGVQDILTSDGSMPRKWTQNEILKERQKRHRISAGTREALAKRKEEGVVLGNPSFAIIRNSDTKAASNAKIEQAYEDALKLIAEIDKLPAKEKYSHNNIAHVLNHRGITTRRGKSINRVTIKRAYERVAR